MSAHHACLRQSLIGIRTALSMLIYTPENTEWLARGGRNHDAGGVMDHLQELIDSLTPEPGDREPFFPAPECNACGNSMPCRCDGTGNG